MVNLAATGWFQDQKFSKEYLEEKYPLDEEMKKTKYQQWIDE